MKADERRPVCDPVTVEIIMVEPTALVVPLQENVEKGNNTNG